MNKCFYTAVFILASCGRTEQKQQATSPDSSIQHIQNSSVEPIVLTDKTIKFLWRESKYNEEFKDSFNVIVLDEAFCKTITDPERAALGYVATFIGNECSWDGEYKEDRSNLKCRILTALNLGYQCSPGHLGFLRKWFKNDKPVLTELEDGNCPTTPDGATIQDTFDEMTLTIKGNTISVFYKASGVNVREGESWSWTETDHFEFDKDHIRLVKKDKSKVQHQKFNTGS